MDKTKRKKAAVLAASAAAFSLMIFGAVSLGGALFQKDRTEPVFSDSVAATISPKVIDGATGEPVKNAVIVIPEADKTYTTDDNGSAGTLSAPVNADSRFKSILEKPWGEVTVLVYAEGYAPCAVFDYMVAKGENRDGPLIMLFPAEGSPAPYSLVEPPHREWVDALVEKYRP